MTRFQRTRRLVSLSLALWCAAPIVATAQTRVTPEAGLPLKPTRTVRFTTDEGTWISLDVSPDGRTIVFDLVGDLYTLPIAGGKATRLTHGMAADATPKFSPDGKRIAFMTDRSGRNQLWVMQADGTAPRQVTRQLPVAGFPIWTPDGRALIAAQSDSREALGVSGIWKYDVASGNGASVLPDTLPFPGHPQRSGYRYFAPATVHPNGKTLWFSEWTGTLPDARKVSALRVFDLVTRTAAPLETPDGNGTRPVVSPDGRWLAYFAEQTAPNRTVLRLRDVSAGSDGADRLLAVLEPHIMLRVTSSYPSYAFTPDSRAVIVVSGGKFVRVDVADGRVTPIPFTADVALELGPLVRVPRKLEGGPLTVRKLSGVVRSPDGRRLAFSAVGKVWVTTDGRTVTRLTTDGMPREFDPVFSPDGRWIAFATWSNAHGGHIWTVPASGGTPVALTTDSAAYYSVPRWTPDSRRLAFVAVADYHGVTGFGTNHGPWSGKFSWVHAAGGPVHHVTSIPVAFQYERVAFDFTVRGDSARAYYMDQMVLKSVGLDDGVVRAELTVDPGESGVEWVRGMPSPDGNWLAMLNDVEVVVLPWPRCAGAAACVVRLDQSPPLVKVSHDGAIQPSWSPDGQWLSWVRANTVFRARIADLTGPGVRSRPESLVINLQVPRVGGAGQLMLRGARLITMASRGVKHTPTPDGGVRATTDPVVIERGDLLIKDRRIVALGPTGTIAVPRDARVIDVSGKTIIPGLLDLHADALGYGARYAHTISWDATANLAYGVTTARNPGVQHFDTGELVESGALLGPRFFGFMKGGSPTVTSLAHARQAMRARKLLGEDLVKAGTSGYSRTGQQWTIMAARLEGIHITNHWYEGTVQDGNSGVEHSQFQDQHHRMYRDWVELTARSGTTWTPTMVVALRHQQNQKEQNSLFERFERCVDYTSPKVRRFLPPPLVAKSERGYDRLPCNPAFTIDAVANAGRSARDVLRAGGNVAASSHGNSLWGVLMMHWELETMVRGGMTPAEALRVGTLNGARALGVESDLGSLEVGKLADLVVLDRNPLEDIRHTMAIRSVMKSGVLYEGDTMDELWPASRPFEGNPWGPMRH